MQRKEKLIFATTLIATFMIVGFQTNVFAENTKTTDASAPEKVITKTTEKMTTKEPEKMVEEKMDMKSESKKVEKKETIPEKNTEERMKEKAKDKSSMKWYRGIPVS